MNWDQAKKLKVGDMVCDCICRHMKIKEIKPIVIPDESADNGHVDDCVLIFEDGSECRTLLCQPADHHWVHPEPLRDHERTMHHIKGDR